MKTHDNNFLYGPLPGNFLAVFVGVTIMSLCTYINGDHGIVYGHGPMLIGLFVSTVLVTWLHAYREAIRIEINHQIINHAKRFEVRAAVIIGANIIIHLLAERTTSGFIRAGFGALYTGGIFLLTFDYMLNFHRDKALFYVSKAVGAAWWDRLWAKVNNPVIVLVVKILIFLLTMAAYNYSFVIDSHGR